MFKENVSLLFSWHFSNDVALKSKLVRWGNKCFGQVYRALLAVNHLHFCSEHLVLLLGSTDWSHKQYRWKSFLGDCSALEPLAVPPLEPVELWLSCPGLQTLQVSLMTHRQAV
ncbi:hypothetical protein Nmel_010663 [Mimus melanotis]